MKLCSNSQPGLLYLSSMSSSSSNLSFDFDPILPSQRCPTLPNQRWLYDVFLTFHTECQAITSLKGSIWNAGIKAFIDNNREITPSLLEVIDRSRIVIIVFTKLYGSCKKCRDILDIIMEMHCTGKEVMPILCDMTPSDLSRVDRNGKSKGWGDVLAQVFFKRRSSAIDSERETRYARLTPLTGWRMSANVSSHENEIIKEITRSISQELDTTHMGIPRRHLVGIQLRVDEVLHLSEYYSIRDSIGRVKDSFIVGIWGVGGSGKTTIAKNIYDAIKGDFEAKSFVASINNAWETDDGQLHLRRQILSDLVVGNKFSKFSYVKALVVLDDISQKEQLVRLWEDIEYIGNGCMILLTTRHKHILDFYPVKYVYEVKQMNKKESLELFSWNAFKQSSPINSFSDMAKEVVTYCEGLPLVLEVLGALLFRRTIYEWTSVLQKLKSIPTGQIQEKLQISFEYLDEAVKEMFYTIACFHVGENKFDVTERLSSFQFPVETGIKVLIQHSLVRVDDSNKLYMNDLLQEIGKEMDPAKPKPKGIYDVFLSFRGDDTRKSFATHLYVALKKVGIEVFMDNEIRKGENNSSSLMQAIESSKMSIIVLSIDYAGSTWCLNELEKIMEYHRNSGQKVLPIFYGVQPSDVRKQTGTFGTAFESLITRISGSDDKILSWMRALYEVAYFTGWDSNHYRTDADLIDDVIEDVTMKLNDSTYLFVAHHQVGVKSRMQEIIELLSERSNEILVVGIFGMGGIGKTTIAKAIYNKIGQSFDAKCFLSNIREAWEQENGPVHLQERLLSDILQRRMALQNVELGKNIMKKRFCHKRALVILDDVTNVVQLDALFGSREWFGPGSKIVITTRDNHLLKFLQADNICNMREMNDEESLELFSWHAFKQANPTEDFVELSKRVTAYSEGLPLALEILGSYLFDRPIHVWGSVLDRLKELPNDQIRKKLKISYDGLSNDAEKDIFLDICCFFIGRDRTYTTQILDGCGLYAEIGISRLVELSLVKVDKHNKLHMHGLLRDMGREIIRELSPLKPEERTRLWIDNDVVEVLTHSLGTRTIKGLALNSSKSNILSFDSIAFEMMTRLRLLQLGHVKLDGNYKYLSKELRWICWHGFPLSYMPKNFYQGNVVVINLKYSYLTQVWENCQLLGRLKILNLSHSYYLRQTPDFSKLPNLERLILKDCPCLSSIHPSIGDLKYLILLNLKNCKSLSDLPRSLYNLKSLKSLDFSGCIKIHKLEEGFEQMESLTTLLANETAIIEVPRSLLRSRSIQYVSLCGYEGLPYGLFSPLVWSWSFPTNNRRFLHKAFASMPFLLRHLFHSLSNQSNGNSKAKASTSQISQPKTPALSGYHDQVHTVRAENFLNSLTIQVGGYNKVTDTLLKTISQGRSDGGLENSLPRDNYPRWLVFEDERPSILFKVPQVVGCCLKGIVLHIIYSSLQDKKISVYPVGFMITNFTKITMEMYKQDATTTFTNEEWQKIKSNLEPGNEVEVEVRFAYKYVVKKTLIYLVYVEESDMLSITE